MLLVFEIIFKSFIKKCRTFPVLTGAIFNGNDIVRSVCMYVYICVRVCLCAHA